MKCSIHTTKKSSHQQSLSLPLPPYSYSSPPVLQSKISKAFDIVLFNKVAFQKQVAFRVGLSVHKTRISQEKLYLHPLVSYPLKTYFTNTSCCEN